MTKAQFLNKFGDAIKRADLVINQSGRLYVLFPDEQKVGIKTLKAYVNRMKSENVFRAILVCQQNLTPFCEVCYPGFPPEISLGIFPGG